MADEFDLVKISELPAATTPGEYDVLAGVQGGDTSQFSFAVILAWMQQAITATAIGAVPYTRKVNGKALSTDIALTAADVSAIPTSDKGVAGGVAELGNDGKVPSAQLPSIASTASDVTYDNTASGLTADDVQEALDELAEEKVDQSELAYVEAGATATQTYVIGDYFIHDDEFCTAILPIAIGDTLTKDYNYETTNFARGLARIRVAQELANFTGNVSTQVTLSISADHYSMLIMQLYDSDGNIVNAVTMPTIFFRNLTAKIYGSSSSQWGSFLLSSDYTKGTFNRTSANTNRVRILGYARIY